MPNKVRVCVVEAEEGTFQRKSWVAMEGAVGRQQEEKRIASHCLQIVGACQVLGYRCINHLQLDLPPGRNVHS